MGEFTIELNDNDKLNDTNYLDWVSRMDGILTLKTYYGLVTNTKTPEEVIENDKLEPQRRHKAAALLKINCIIKDNYGLVKCDVEKKSPSLDDIWEFIRKFLQCCENNNKHSSQALLASKSNNINNNQNKKRQDSDYTKCSPGWHNPLTKHNESDCNFLKGDKNGLSSKKPIQSLVASTGKLGSKSIILNSGATTSMFNDPKIFTNIAQLTQQIELANGSTIQASGTGTVQIELPHCILELSNCLLVKNLSYNLISLGTIVKPNYKILTHDNKLFELVDHNNNIILNGTFNSGNFEVTIEGNKALATIKNHNNILTLHQASRNPSPEYLGKMFPTLTTTNLQCPPATSSKSPNCCLKEHFPHLKENYNLFTLTFLDLLKLPLIRGTNTALEYSMATADMYGPPS
ncbi:hypothetical protein O181_078187 [Austropuccinia psidii MF-1]|uniref:Retrovirus-related Pol polyprotein from transposon TNT 1-94-like beta-barrel domain-containing protein n=1 Tax=Austropuccinia psidii MF-1 TaxID=1389203 RepID=A0A9Q3FJY4_9BASI|nr:hypothetical protein [Austropuccinia psidii MF-1]